VSDGFGWTFRRGDKTVEQLNREQQYLLPSFEIEFPAPIDSQVPKLNWTHIDALTALSHVDIPAIKRIIKIPHLVQHTSYTIWILVAIVLIVLVAAAGFAYFKYGDNLQTLLSRKRNGKLPARVAYNTQTPPKTQAKGEEPDETDQVMVQIDRGTSTGLYPTLE
jgi:hypothetical protein